MESNCYFFEDVVHSENAAGVGFQLCGEVLSPDECDHIFDLAKEWSVPLLSGDNPIPNETYTDARMGYVYLEDESVKYYEKLTSVGRHWNDQYWKMDVTGVFECFDVIEYSAPHGGMHWHIDLSTGGASTANRKVNILTQLSDPNDYEGGDLQLFVPHDKLEIPIMNCPREKGSVVVFPPWIPHRVTPVTKGTRKSMVTYLHGPAIR
jgi:PKHD-type hydroxylase